MPSRVGGGDSVTEALIEYHLLPGCFYSSLISLTGCFLNGVLCERTERDSSHDPWPLFEKHLDRGE